MEQNDFIGQGIFFFARARMRVYRSALLSLLALAGIFVSPAAGANSIALDAKTQQQIAAISDPQIQICLPAIEALGSSRNSAVIKPLSDAFAKENRPVVRRYIVDALGHLRNKATIPVLKQALNDPDIQTRQSAVAAIGLLSASDVQTLLLEHAATEKNPLIKRQMIHHFGLLQTPEAKNALKKFSQDSDSSVRDMAGRKLGTDKQEKR